MEDEEKKLKTRADFDTDSEYYTYIVTEGSLIKKKQEEKRLQEEQEKLKNQKQIYQCTNCRYIIDQNDEKSKYTIEEVMGKLKGRCPICKKQYSFKKITKAQKEKYLKDEEEKKKIAEKRKQKQSALKAKFEVDMIIYKLKDLLKELKEDLLVGKITPNRFTKLFVDLSYRIAKVNRQELDIDWIDYRDRLVGLSQTTLDFYDINIDCQKEYEGYEKNIEEDELFIKLLNKYNSESDNTYRTSKLEEKQKKLNSIKSPEDRKLYKMYVLKEPLSEKELDESSNEKIDSKNSMYEYRNLSTITKCRNRQNAITLKIERNYRDKVISNAEKNEYKYTNRQFIQLEIALEKNIKKVK